MDAPSSTGTSRRLQPREKRSLFAKTKRCALDYMNLCTKGDKCLYVHSNAEQRQPPNMYKTRLCEADRFGRCGSDSCKFAHGMADLRPVHEGSESIMEAPYSDEIRLVRLVVKKRLPTPASTSKTSNSLNPYPSVSSNAQESHDQTSVSFTPHSCLPQPPPTIWAGGKWDEDWELLREATTAHWGAGTNK
eukprot:GHVN01075724.1.p1 GENE.GHVN01075724.1~~GHVN01075724.1.p1  ORF type:complete len:190 (+),score=14.71 GHVN01075724.1:807-1376(+)